MKRKAITGPITFKGDGEEGQFRAVFATLNVVDHDGDVTIPGAFTDGEKVRISYWGHRWGDLPVGRGEIHSDEKEAWVDGHFFLDTEGGRETYNTVKNLGELQEWSYGFDILERSEGEFEGQQVQFLRRLKVHEVSPVMLGAGVGTRTLAIKAEGLKPYPNEHACRLRPPGDFEEDSFRRTTREHEGKTYAVIMGRLRGETTMTEQAYRYPKDDWTAAQARSHCKGHEGRFEAAADEGKARKELLDRIREEPEEVQALHDELVSLGAKCRQEDDNAAGSEGTTEDEAGNGKSSGAAPSTIRVQVESDLIELETLEV